MTEGMATKHIGVLSTEGMKPGDILEFPYDTYTVIEVMSDQILEVAIHPKTEGPS